MPEIRFSVRWPDGTVERCYSPSTIVKDYLTPETSYLLGDFMHRCSAALAAASDRVQARYGMPCNLARAERARIEARAASFATSPNASVAVLAFEEE